MAGILHDSLHHFQVQEVIIQDGDTTHCGCWRGASGVGGGLQLLQSLGDFLAVNAVQW